MSPPRLGRRDVCSQPALFLGEAWFLQGARKVQVSTKKSEASLSRGALGEACSAQDSLRTLLPEAWVRTSLSNPRLLKETLGKASLAATAPYQVTVFRAYPTPFLTRISLGPHHHHIGQASLSFPLCRGGSCAQKGNRACVRQ